MIVVIFHVIFHGHVARKLGIEAMLLIHALLGLLDTWRESERASYFCFPPRETERAIEGNGEGATVPTCALGYCTVLLLPCIINPGGCYLASYSCRVMQGSARCIATGGCYLAGWLL